MSTASDQFAVWLEKEHPDVYEILYAQAISQGAGRLSGFGDDDSSDIISDYGQQYGDSEPTVTYSDPTLQDVGFLDNTTLSTPSVTDSPTGTDSSGGILSALSNVGSWLVSAQGLTSVANVATAVLKVQQTQEVAQMQQQVIAQNAARAAAGQAPIPITYITGANGAVQPVYDTGTMQTMPAQLEAALNAGQVQQVTLADGSVGYTVTPSVLSSLFGSAIPWYVWVLGAGLLLALVA